MSKKLWEFEDKFGSISLEKRGNILLVNINGACGVDLITFYTKSVTKIAPLFGGQKWGVLYNTLGYEAATPEAEKAFFELSEICLELGCRCEAFCMTSPVAIAQASRIRLSYGNTIPIEDAIFDTPEVANVYLTKILEKLNTKSYHTN
jgi:hypothetical protein